jgi:hypothetical protein
VALRSSRCKPKAKKKKEKLKTKFTKERSKYVSGAVALCCQPHRSTTERV